MSYHLSIFASRDKTLQLVNGEVKDTQRLSKALLSEPAKLLCGLAFNCFREITEAKSCLCLST